MKAKLQAAARAAVTTISVLAMGLLLLPMAGLAKEQGAATMAKQNLQTPKDFIEYASINDIDIHELFFNTVLYEGTETCLLCHQTVAESMLDMGHFKWQNPTDRITGLEGQEHGKNDLLNNFCIAVPTNEARCTQCHVGIGYRDKNFNFDNPANLDCLVCHDQSGTYKKDPKQAGAPAGDVDLNLVARSISLGADPTRAACTKCHANAGGGDNVKHGDIAMNMINTTREYDVHMGTDGADFRCTACHGANHDPKAGFVNHGNAGMSLHSVYEGEMKQCTDCHGGQQQIHAGTPAESLISKGWHEKLACQVCHIPAIARHTSTKVEWYWSDAGQDIDPPKDPETGRYTYDKKKGTFVWKNNVRPVLRYSNGKWDRKVINADDKYDSEPIQLAVPHGSYEDPDAMIYPFKLMVGNQPVDPVTKTILVPHLFPGPAGPNPYWKSFDWNMALQQGANYTGQDYSGEYAFASTEMLLSVNHEVAPKEQALGAGPSPDNCQQCHTTDYIDWDEIGWTADPFEGGVRESELPAAVSVE